MTKFIEMDETIGEELKGKDYNRSSVRKQKTFSVKLEKLKTDKLYNMFGFSHGDCLGRLLNESQCLNMIATKKDFDFGIDKSYCLQEDLNRTLKFTGSCSTRYLRKYKLGYIEPKFDFYVEAKPAVFIYSPKDILDLIRAGKAVSYIELPHIDCKRPEESKREFKHIETHIHDRADAPDPKIVIFPQNAYYFPALNIEPDFNLNDLGNVGLGEKEQKFLKQLYPKTTFIGIQSNKPMKFSIPTKTTEDGIPLSGEEIDTYYAYLVKKICSYLHP